MVTPPCRLCPTPNTSVATTGQEEFTLDTAAELAAEESGAQIQGRSPWALAGRRLRRNKFALFFLALFVLICVACLLGGVYAKHVSHLGCSSPADSPRDPPCSIAVRANLRTKLAASLAIGARPTAGGPS